MNMTIITSLPCKRKPIVIVADEDNDPFPRHHLVLQDRTGGQLRCIGWSRAHFRAEVLVTARVHKQNVGHVFIATFERGDTCKGLLRVGVDEVVSVVNKVNSI